MWQLAVSSHFQKQLQRFSPRDQQQVTAVLKHFLAGLTAGQLAAGQGFKKINGDKYELRVDLRTRIVMKTEGHTLVCHLVGNHENVRRYLPHYRHR